MLLLIVSWYCKIRTVTHNFTVRTFVKYWVLFNYILFLELEIYIYNISNCNPHCFDAYPLMYSMQYIGILTVCIYSVTLAGTPSYFSLFHKALTGTGAEVTSSRCFWRHFLCICLIRFTFSTTWSLGSFSIIINRTSGSISVSQIYAPTTIFKRLFMYRTRTHSGRFLKTYFQNHSWDSNPQIGCQPHRRHNIRCKAVKWMPLYKCRRST